MDDSARTVDTGRFRGAALRCLRVAVVAGPDAGVVCEASAEQRVTVGSATDNVVVLRDPTVSRYHIELERAHEGVEVRDLGSLNGTWIGAVQMRAGIVPAGARLQIGSTTLLVEDGATERPDLVEVPPHIPGLVAVSGAMRHVASLVERFGANAVSVLIRGETGTGKEVVARGIHEMSARKDKPFIVVDCGSMPATLVASELFGHERGAFTGAQRRHTGAFERAQGGTVFLDEIGELPLEVQPTLLGVLERRLFRRIGGEQDVAVDVRVLAATHRDLRTAVNTGAFRADLYYRLAVATVYVPPLRERVGDIEPLIEHFVREITGSVAGHPFGLEALEALRGRPWAGNVRELRNVVESALAMGTVQEQDGASEGAGSSAVETSARPSYRDARAQALVDFELGYLKSLISECAGNASEAARRAKMDRMHLVGLLRRHALR